MENVEKIIKIQKEMEKNNEFNDYHLLNKYDQEYFRNKYFEQINKIHKEKRKRKICVFPACENKTIKKSHSIQKQGPLREIAEKGKLIYPQPQNSITNIDFVEIGIENASTFPGFCEKHEKIFLVFEKNNDYLNNMIILQNFRTLSREIVNRTITGDIWQEKLSEYFNDQLDEYSKTANKYYDISPIKLTGYEDYITRNFEKLINDNNEVLSLLININKEFEKILKEEDSELFHINIDTDLFLPITLSGFSLIPLYIEELDKVYRFFLLCSILPHKKGTVITLTTLTTYEKLAKYYIEKNMNCHLNIISAIESWMIYGTDNWYMNPTFYNSLSDEIVKKMKEEFINLNKTPQDDVSFSIFTDIRKKIISEIEEDLNLNKNEYLYRKKIIKFANNKLRYNNDLEQTNLLS